MDCLSLQDLSMESRRFLTTITDRFGLEWKTNINFQAKDGLDKLELDKLEEPLISSRLSSVCLTHACSLVMQLLEMQLVVSAC